MPSVSTSARSAVSGVRSSWAASATSWSCARRASSRPASKALTARARRTDSAPPCSGTRCERSRSRAAPSTFVARRRSGTRPRSATSAPRMIAKMTPPMPAIKSRLRKRSSDDWISSTERATCNAKLGSMLTVSARMVEPSTVNVSYSEPPALAISAAFCVVGRGVSFRGRRTISPLSLISSAKMPGAPKRPLALPPKPRLGLARSGLRAASPSRSAAARRDASTSP